MTLQQPGIEALGDRGPAHVVLMVRKPGGAVAVRRWTEVRPPIADELDSVLRELRRAQGELVWEPAGEE